MSNITQVVNTDKNLKTLKKTVHATDLDQLLSSSGPFTFFAPSDAAFEKLETGVLAGLSEPGNKLQLTGLIQEHIVNGKIRFSDLKDGDSLTTINGTALAVKVTEGHVAVNGANIVAREMKISNGVIHGSDKVFTK